MKRDKHLVILKGLNRVRKEGWKGMKLNISYIGYFNNKMFGIANRKITREDAKYLNSAPFHNEKLNAVSQIKFQKKNFTELNLVNEISSRNRCGYFEEIMRNQIIPECSYTHLFSSLKGNCSLQSSNYSRMKSNSLSCDNSKKPPRIQLNGETTRHNHEHIKINIEPLTHRHERSISTLKSNDIQVNHHQEYLNWKTKRKKMVLPLIQFHNHSKEEGRDDANNN